VYPGKGMPDKGGTCGIVDNYGFILNKVVCLGRLEGMGCFLGGFVDGRWEVEILISFNYELRCVPNNHYLLLVGFIAQNYVGQDRKRLPRC